MWSSPSEEWFAELPARLEWTGEFGSELVLFRPFCRWLSDSGFLEDREICTYQGMRCFYERFNCKNIIEKNEIRRYIPPHRRPAWLPIKNEHDFDGIGKSSFHCYGDLRNEYLDYFLDTRWNIDKKPILVVHNKYNYEWGHEPVNFISTDSLNTIFSRLKSRYTIVYIRHKERDEKWGFSNDANRMKELEDTNILVEHPEVYGFQELYQRTLSYGCWMDMNTFKNILFSRCYAFITSQGGGAHHIAMFSNSLIAVLHRKGLETRWAYFDGYYQFMAPIPPTLMVCHNEMELVRALKVFVGNTMVGDGGQ